MAVPIRPQPIQPIRIFFALIYPSS